MVMKIVDIVLNKQLAEKPKCGGKKCHLTYASRPGGLDNLIKHSI